MNQLVDGRRDALRAAADRGAAEARAARPHRRHPRSSTRGHLHLVTQVQRELEDIFVGLGYRVAEGPEVEDDWHNFEALNIPPAHPARSMQDTLYVRLGRDEQVMLRTHTSPVQIRTMETQDAADLRRRSRAHVPQRDARRPPLARCSTRSSASPSTAGSRSPTCSARSRPFAKRCSTTSRSAPASAPTSSRTPSRRPSSRCSCIFCHGAGCRVCSHTGWIELGGCGMVDPNVFGAVGIDPEEWQGFAFGFGLERIAMIRYGIDEIRTFFDNDVRFLRPVLTMRAPRCPGSATSRRSRAPSTSSSAR